MKRLLKAVTIGDIKGIGIEILIKLWRKKRKNIGNFILITNYKLLIKHLKNIEIKIPITQISNFNDVSKLANKYFLIYNIKAKNNIYNTYNSMLHAYSLNKKKICSSIITLPLNKEKIIKNINKNFIGQTELFQKLDKKKYSNMIFYSKKNHYCFFNYSHSIKKCSKYI